jgi:F0F1-type ATP synthase membrane subunit c/vacuolar-type H+-ATPase subunit K
MYLTIGQAIAYGLALLATGFLLGILAKPFKGQVTK